MPVANILDQAQETLPANVWDNPDSPKPELKGRIARWVTKYIYNVLEAGGYDHPERWAKLYVTGSLTTYQYSSESDMDISIFVDAKNLPEWSRAEMVGLMVSSADGVHVPGTSFPLQCYVVPPGIHPADLYKPGLRSGYSIKDAHWVEPPDRQRVHNVEAEQNGFYVYAMQMADKMQSLLRYEPHKATQFYHQIHERRRRDQALGKGDFSESNIIYKFLDKRGLLPEQAHYEAHVAGALEDAIHESFDYGYGYVNDKDKRVQIELGDADPFELFDEVEELAKRKFPGYDIDVGSEDHEWDTKTPGWEKFAALDHQAVLDANAGQDLTGLPTAVNSPGLGPLQFHSNADIQRVANEYNVAHGLGPHPTDYVRVNPQNAAQVAQAYEQMDHNPQDPQTAAAYDAMKHEVAAQYQHAVNNGYKFEFYPHNEDGSLADPYPNSPREAVLDLHHNKHMYVYPTHAGYGNGEDIANQPLLEHTGVTWGGQPVTHNDMFRAIHDFYGHAKEGLGFRADGEDNAYRQHAAMFSPLAQQALAAETRGQNSWVNFGPHGAANQTAGQADTVYAPQKTGLLPSWATDPNLHQPQLQPQPQVPGTFAAFEDTPAPIWEPERWQQIAQDTERNWRLDRERDYRERWHNQLRQERSDRMQNEFHQRLQQQGVQDPAHYMQWWQNHPDYNAPAPIEEPETPPDYVGQYLQQQQASPSSPPLPQTFSSFGWDVTSTDEGHFNEQNSRSPRTSSQRISGESGSSYPMGEPSGDLWHLSNRSIVQGNDYRPSSTVG